MKKTMRMCFAVLLSALMYSMPVMAADTGAQAVDNQGSLFFLLAGGLVVIIIAVVASVVTSVVSTLASAVDDADSEE